MYPPFTPILSIYQKIPQSFSLFDAIDFKTGVKDA